MAGTTDLNDPLPQDALDHALRSALAPPPLPDGFRARLAAAIHRESPVDLAARRRQLEREHRERLEQLQRDSVRLRLRTLGSLLGGAFFAGVGTSLAWPWISATFAPHAGLALGLIGAGIGAAIGLTGWQRSGASLR